LYRYKHMYSDVQMYPYTTSVRPGTNIRDPRISVIRSGIRPEKPVIRLVRIRIWILKFCIRRIRIRIRIVKNVWAEYPDPLTSHTNEFIGLKSNGSNFKFIKDIDC